MRFAPHTNDDVAQMLSRLGFGSLDRLFDQIPESVRLERPLALPDGVSELELVEDLRTLATRNRSADDLVCFAGGGAYDHYVPAVVWALAGRSEFYTSYTPYQPELSQGVLQALFEYQSMVCELTALDVSNASLYDGATALVEAVNLARAATGRGRVLVSETVDPRYLATLRTYGLGAGYEPETFPAPEGRGGAPAVAEDVGCVIVQHPNAYGILEPARELFATARAGGARAIQVFDPLSLGVLAPPGDLGADVAVAEGQVLGNHLSFGGPYLGVIAARMEDVRRMPGRIVGETVDVDGRTGYVLTLQAREQHIRRETAVSNICTNQTLMAIAAAVYLAWLGPEGLAELGRLCSAKAAYAAERLADLPGVDLRYPDAPFFKEFALRLPLPAAEVRRALADRGYLAGVPVGDLLVVAVTERRTRSQIDGLVEAMAGVLG
ncbi:MAG TPA: aminomethyl-transferring glycine dehydrogenase subunit GcvPA [Actinomycetota bacterium]|nr:aminomethyl-transferring glycine dehydrogenase subunit GcvPA [Actinomycetota bacterium]